SKRNTVNPKSSSRLRRCQTPRSWLARASAWKRSGRVSARRASVWRIAPRSALPPKLGLNARDQRLHERRTHARRTLRSRRGASLAPVTASRKGSVADNRSVAVRPYAGLERASRPGARRLRLADVWSLGYDE